MQIEAEDRRLFALTDDGVVWLLSDDGGAFHWEKIPNPPDRVTEVDDNAYPRARSR